MSQVSRLSCLPRLATVLALLPLALFAATGDDVQYSVSRMQPSVARQKVPATIADGATYLKWKWRTDLSDPRTGLSNAAIHPALVLSLAIDSALERGVDAFSTGMTYNYVLNRSANRQGVDDNDTTGRLVEWRSFKIP